MKEGRKEGRKEGKKVGKKEGRKEGSQKNTQTVVFLIILKIACEAKLAWRRNSYLKFLAPSYPQASKGIILQQRT